LHRDESFSQSIANEVLEQSSTKLIKYILFFLFDETTNADSNRENSFKYQKILSAVATRNAKAASRFHASQPIETF